MNEAGQEQTPHERGDDENDIRKLSQPYYPPDDADGEEYWTELRAQTDRGLAVLGASLLEWRIKGAIRARFKIWDNRATDIFGKDMKGGKLGFWEQSEIAYGLGLIGPITLNDLQRIGQIRNKFAHNPGIRDFSHKDVTVIADALETPEYLAQQFERQTAGDPLVGRIHRATAARDKYVAAAHAIANAIWLAGIHYLRLPATDLPNDYW